MSDQTICPKCGYQNPPYRVKCKNCDTPLPNAPVTIIKRRWKPFFFPLILIYTVLHTVLLLIVAYRLYLNHQIYLTLMYLAFYLLACSFVLPNVILFHLRRSTASGKILDRAIQGRDGETTYVVLEFKPDHKDFVDKRFILRAWVDSRLYSPMIRDKDEITLLYVPSKPQIALLEPEVRPITDKFMNIFLGLVFGLLGSLVYLQSPYLLAAGSIWTAAIGLSGIYLFLTISLLLLNPVFIPSNEKLPLSKEP